MFLSYSLMAHTGHFKSKACGIEGSLGISCRGLLKTRVLRLEHQRRGSDLTIIYQICFLEFVTVIFDHLKTLL
jgi:hypothetical protein